MQIRIGDKLTKGLGAGGDPARGARAAEESRDELKDAVRGAEMVFVTAGMGGGTGTGASPDRRRGRARDRRPDHRRRHQALRLRRHASARERAEEGIEALREKVDTLIVIPNDRLLTICDPKASLEDAFKHRR